MNLIVISTDMFEYGVFICADKTRADEIAAAISRRDPKWFPKAMAVIGQPANNPLDWLAYAKPIEEVS